MRTKEFLVIALSAVTISAGGSFAQTVEHSSETAEVVVIASSIAELQVVMDMIETLKAEGYTYFEIRRTFLGRARIIAYSATEMREIIINPNTHEILRDLVKENPGYSAGNSNGQSAQAEGMGNNGNDNTGDHNSGGMDSNAGGGMGNNAGGGMGN